MIYTYITSYKSSKYGRQSQQIFIKAKMYHYNLIYSICKLCMMVREYQLYLLLQGRRQGKRICSKCTKTFTSEYVCYLKSLFSFKIPTGIFVVTRQIANSFSGFDFQNKFVCIELGDFFFVSHMLQKWSVIFENVRYKHLYFNLY